MDMESLNESKLSAADRRKLPDNMFGLPKDRQFPLHDEKHVKSAITMFRHCPKTKRKELARNIQKAAKRLGIEVNKSGIIGEYLEEAASFWNMAMLMEGEQQWTMTASTVLSLVKKYDLKIGTFNVIGNAAYALYGETCLIEYADFELLPEMWERLKPRGRVEKDGDKEVLVPEANVRFYKVATLHNSSFMYGVPVVDLQDMLKEAYNSNNPKEVDRVKEYMQLQFVSKMSPTELRDETNKALTLLNSGRKIWFISDTHFWMKAVGKFERRPAAFSELIIRNWKAQVGPGDIIVHFGDIMNDHLPALSGRLKMLIAELPGLKILIRGNNDFFPSKFYRECGFDCVLNELKWKNYIFTHVPVPVTYGYNIHGHLHGWTYGDWQHICVAVDKTGWAPIELKQIETHGMRVVNLMGESSNYERPYTADEIKKNHPDKADMLLKDPAHKWRAETGIELIHKEPSTAEQARIWDNWNRMTPEQKIASDKKCRELHGMSNRELHAELMGENTEIGELAYDFELKNHLIMSKPDIDEEAHHEIKNSILPGLKANPNFDNSEQQAGEPVEESITPILANNYNDGEWDETPEEDAAHEKFAMELTSDINSDDSSSEFKDSDAPEFEDPIDLDPVIRAINFANFDDAKKLCIEALHSCKNQGQVMELRQAILDAIAPVENHPDAMEGAEKFIIWAHTSLVKEFEQALKSEAGAWETIKGSWNAGQKYGEPLFQLDCAIGECKFAEAKSMIMKMVKESDNEIELGLLLREVQHRATHAHPLNAAAIGNHPGYPAFAKWVEKDFPKEIEKRRKVVQKYKGRLNEDGEILQEAGAVGAKRKRIEKIVLDVMGIMDSTGHNAKEYKAFFSSMNDSQFSAWAKKFLADEQENFYLEITPMEHEPSMNDIEKAAKYLGVPLHEHVYMPFTNPGEEPVRTQHPVPVGLKFGPTKTSLTAGKPCYKRLIA